jgi:hypothetical protein
LENSGKDAAALALSDRYYTAFFTAYKAKGDICENLMPSRPEMMGVGTFVGWGGLAPIAILIEDIFGIRVDAPAHRIDWHVRRLERHGIENLRFGETKVSLVCEARSSESDPCKLSVDSDGAFLLAVHAGSMTISRHIGPGHTTLTVDADSQLAGVGRPQSGE